MALICFIATLLSFLFALLRAENFNQALEDYPANATNFTISNVTTENNQRIIDFLGIYATKPGVTLSRFDTKLSAVDSTPYGKRIGIYASPENLKNLEFEFLGTQIISTEQLSTLMRSSQNKSLGLDDNSANALTRLPELAFAHNLSVYKIQDLLQLTQTVNGKYKITGLDTQGTNKFLITLASELGVPAETLTAPLRGESSNDTIKYFTAVAGLLAMSLLLYFSFLLQILRAGKALGAHMLLGWSKTDFIKAMFGKLWVCTLPVLAISIISVFYTSPGYAFTIQLLPHLFYPATVTIVITFITLAIATLALNGIKPITAIKGFSPKKFLLSLLTLIYISTSYGFFAASTYLDSPVREMANLNKISNLWHTVADKYIYHSAQPGADAANFTNQTSSYFHDFYNWYRSIENQPGVSLIHTEFYSADVIARQRAAGYTTPAAPIWYFAASPNYLRENNIQVPQELLAKAAAGERVYLISDTVAAANQKAITAALSETALRQAAAAQEIKTDFIQNQQLNFAQITLDKELFTWNTDFSQEFTTKNLVLLITTSNNMTYFEAESLAATGLTNSYIKLSAEAKSAYTSLSYLADYNLDDNTPYFVPISDFIAGLQKNINVFTQLFGVLITFLALFIVFSLAAALKIFALLNRYRLAVFSLLGHSHLKIFLPVYTAVSVCNLLALIIMLSIGTVTGLIGVALLCIIQLATLAILSKMYARDSATTVIKSF